MEKKVARRAATQQRRESADRAFRRCYGARTLILPEAVQPCAGEGSTLAAVPEVSQKLRAGLLPAVAEAQEEEGPGRRNSCWRDGAVLLIASSVH